jgi:charged multivesicular body protein 3
MSEMVDETMDMMDDENEELDDEAEAEVEKVLFEITNGKLGDANKVGVLPVGPLIL